MSYKFKILNDYQAGSLNGKAFRLGADYSFDYVDDKGIMLYIYDEHLNSTVSFKTFLKDFSISFNIKAKDEKAVDGGKNTGISDFEMAYNFNLDIPALSVNDARVNAARLEEVDRMITSNFISEGTRVMTSENVRYVLMSNLIHNGKYVEKKSIQSGKDVFKYGVPCYTNSFNYTIDTELGYFEYFNKLFPKSYTATFSLIAQAGETEMGKFLIAGFERSGDYYKKDIRTWPFGV